MRALARSFIFALGLGGIAAPPAAAQAPAAPQEPAARQEQAPAAPASSETRIGLIYRVQPQPSSYDAEAPPEDEGVAGARMAIADNNTTGRFTKQSYVLDEAALAEDGPGAVESARGLVETGTKYLILALPADEVLAVADALKDTGAVIFNAAAPDDRLRGADCRKNLFHVAPSRAMQTDALAQYLRP